MTKFINLEQHADEFNKNLLVEAITKTSNALFDNDKSYDCYENDQYQWVINTVKKLLKLSQINLLF